MRYANRTHRFRPRLIGGAPMSDDRDPITEAVWTTDPRGRLVRVGPYRFRVFPAAQLQPDDLVRYMGGVFHAEEVRRDGGTVIVTTRLGRIGIPVDHEVAVVI